jgi:hypothetical protein
MLVVCVYGSMTGDVSLQQWQQKWDMLFIRQHHIRHDERE